jgi:hypothetical protein
VSVALAARPGEDGPALVARARALDQRTWHLPAALPQPRALQALLREKGLAVCSLGSAADVTPGTLACASALRVRAVVVAGVARGARSPDADAEDLARALHAPLTAGVPLALRNGGDPTDLLDETVCGWLLEALPRLGLWFDPAAALRAARREGGAPLARWTDAWAGRTGGVFVHGLGAAGRGGAHPCEDGPPWTALRESLPGRVPWVLELDPACEEAHVRDALAWLRDLAG